MVDEYERKLEALWELFKAEAKWRAYWRGLREGKGVGTPDLVQWSRAKAEHNCRGMGIEVVLAYSGNVVGVGGL